MSYKKAEHILPLELLEMIQYYIDGECIYIPRKIDRKKDWGANTATRQELALRNEQIYRDYQSGCSTNHLSAKYFLSIKSIQRIILQVKKSN